MKDSGLETTTTSVLSTENKSGVLKENEVINLNNKLKTIGSSWYVDGYGFVIVNSPNPPTTFEELWDGDHDHFFGGLPSEVATKIDKEISETGNISTAQLNNPELTIEDPLTVDNAKILIIPEGPRIILLRYETDSAPDPTLVVNTVKNLQATAEKLGIRANLEKYDIMISPQTPLTYSHQDKKLIFVGVNGVDIESSADAMRVLSHEAGHAFFADMLAFKSIDVTEIMPDSILEPSSDFFNEGMAEYIGLRTNGLSPRDELGSVLVYIYPQALADLRNGTLKGSYDSEDVFEWINSENIPRVAASIHSRLLPAALLQYCTEIGVSPDTIIDTQVTVANERVGQIAETMGIDLSVIKIHDPYWARDYLREHGRDDEIDKFMEAYGQSRLQPLEIIAKITGREPVQIAQDFLQWLGI